MIFSLPLGGGDARKWRVDMELSLCYTIGTLKDTQMPKGFTLHSKYTGDESHGLKVVSYGLQSKIRGDENGNTNQP